MNFNLTVYDIVSQIPPGKVVSYGWIARLAGSPKAARAVGYALHNNPRPGIIPCHRVVSASGNIAAGFAFGGGTAQRELLEAEGIEFDNECRVQRKFFIL